MSWWHADINTWAGTDGTDLHKAYVDIVNAVDERRVSIKLPQLTHAYNTTGDPATYTAGTKNPPLTYNNIVGFSLHGAFYTAAAGVPSLVLQLLNGSPPGLGGKICYGFAKTPDGPGLGDLWDDDGLYAAIGHLVDISDTPPQERNAFNLAATFVWCRRALELLINPVMVWDVSVTPLVESDWMHAAGEWSCDGVTYPDPIPLDYEWTRELTRRPSPPYTPLGPWYGWRGSFATHLLTECPLFVTTLTVEGAMGKATTPRAFSFSETPSPSEIKPAGIEKRASAGDPVVSRYRMVEGPTGFLSRHQLIIKKVYRADVFGQYKLAIRFTPRGAGPVEGTPLKEWVRLVVSGTTCPVVEWLIGGAEFTQPAPGGAGDGPWSSGLTYYSAPGVLAPEVVDRLLIFKEGMTGIPFTGSKSAIVDYGYPWDINDDDIVDMTPGGAEHLNREHLSITGLGHESVFPGGLAHAIMAMNYEYT